MGSYDTLAIAAENSADALYSVSGYSAIVEAFAASAPTEVIEAAIWASPWASGHDANDGHPVVCPGAGRRRTRGHLKIADPRGIAPAALAAAPAPAPHQHQHQHQHRHEHEHEHEHQHR